MFQVTINALFIKKAFKINLEKLNLSTIGNANKHHESSDEHQEIHVLREDIKEDMNLESSFSGEFE